MGVDAWILYRKTDESPLERVKDIPGNGRLYDSGYERGYWPEYAALLLQLMAENEYVYYCGDYYTQEDVPFIHEAQMTLGRLAELNVWWVKFQNRPYVERWDHARRVKEGAE